MIADIVLSFEAVAKMSGVPFRLNREILGDKPLKLPCYIEWGAQKASKPIEPDAIFSVGDKYFLLEADRNTENLLTHNLESIPTCASSCATAMWPTIRPLKRCGAFRNRLC